MKYLKIIVKKRMGVGYGLLSKNSTIRFEGAIGCKQKYASVDQSSTGCKN